jgi:hypothetical protein
MFKQYINERQMCYKARRQSLILYIIGPSQLDIEYVYIINKTDRHDITEILLKVALNTIKQANFPLNICSQILLKNNPKNK